MKGPIKVIITDKTNEYNKKKKVLEKIEETKIDLKKANQDI